MLKRIFAFFPFNDNGDGNGDENVSSFSPLICIIS